MNAPFCDVRLKTRASVVKSRRCSIPCRCTSGCATCAPARISSSFPSSPGHPWSGCASGVAALIVILSVMNGFESELRDRLLSLSAPVRVTASASATVTRRAMAGRRSGASRPWPGLRMSPRTPSCRHSRCASRRWCRSCCAGSTRRPRPAARIWARAIRQGQLSDLKPGSGRRHRRRGDRAAPRARRRRLPDGAHTDGERGRRADTEAARVHRQRASSRWACRITTARWCSPTSRTCARWARKGRRARGCGCGCARCWRPPRVAARVRAQLRAGVRGERLDAR